MRPDRIIVGEVRPRSPTCSKPEHRPFRRHHHRARQLAPAGLSAGAAHQEAVVTVPRDLIVQAIDIVAFLEVAAPIARSRHCSRLSASMLMAITSSRRSADVAHGVMEECL
jgi:hypothetical protein